MKKKNLIISIVFILLLLAACGKKDDEETKNDNKVPDLTRLTPERPETLETAQVKTVLSGDTLELADGRIIHLIGIQSPENGQWLADEATAYTRNLLEGKDIGMEPGTRSGEDDIPEFYVWVGDTLANLEIIKAGFANRSAGSGVMAYTFYFKQAEETAMADHVGIWQRVTSTLKIDFVVFDPPGPDEENLNSEWVRIINNGLEEINLKGYSLHNADNKTFTFGDLVLKSGQRISVLSGCGSDNSREIHWCSQEEIWKNSTDTVFLNSPEGLLIDQYAITGQ